jgi:tRNA-2-methylthio-N6-dimethylallyladenosine synthase
MPTDPILDYNALAGHSEYIAKAKELLGGKLYHIQTYGCQMNAHDSEKLAGMLGEIGMREAASEKDADLVLLNTCCVREHAENRVYGNVGWLMKLKREKPGLIIGVCGCMMQQEGAAAKMLAKMRHVDLAFGTHNLHELPEMLVEAATTGRPFAKVTRGEGCIVEGVPAARNPAVSAFVTIMYGCGNYCSYCIVPYVRGAERSRRPEAILEEIKGLAGSDVREVTLLGQNVNSYGAGTDTGFPELLERIGREAENLKRVRFMTSHPKDLSDRLVEVMAETKIVCKQIHLPVQSGSDRILERMNRHYTAEHYLGLLGKLRAAMPGIGVSSDFIVGFPGETEADFRATLDLVKDARFLSSFTFKYSKRAGTAAAKMEGQVPEETKKERLRRLNALQADITAELDRQAVGQNEEVLVEGPSRRRAGEVSGRTDGGRMVNLKGGEELIGKIINVKINKAMANTLHGEITKHEESGHQ